MWVLVTRGVSLTYTPRHRISTGSQDALSETKNKLSSIPAYFSLHFHHLKSMKVINVPQGVVSTSQQSASYVDD